LRDVVSVESVGASGVLVSEVSLASDAAVDVDSVSSGDADAGLDVVPEDRVDEPVEVDEVEVVPLEPVDVDVDEFVDDESDPEVSDGSADATPCPVNTAAPMPRATASPPIRPTQSPACIHKYIREIIRGRRRLGRTARDCLDPVNSIVAPMCPALSDTGATMSEKFRGASHAASAASLWRGHNVSMELWREAPR
jgi:hypothetical protein